MNPKQLNDLIRSSNFYESVPPQIPKKEEIRLNIASGPNVFPYTGWINYDREDISHYLNYIATTDRVAEMPEHQKKLSNYLKQGGKIDFRVHDMKQGLSQHETNSIDSIYFGQAIEHMNSIYEIPVFLAEFYRVLKPGGVIRITTPDLDLLIKAYLNNDMGKFSVEQPAFYAEADPGSQLAYLMYGACGPNCTWNNYEGHMFLFTKTSMTATLKKAGFKDIEFYYETGKSKDSVMQEQAVDAGMSHSFICEAIK